MEFCEIRKLAISDSAYTYCENYHTGSETPAGPVFTNGVVFIYTRIPWYRNQKPMTHVKGICSVCGKGFVKGICIELEENNTFKFCNDKHYVEWWQQQFPDVELYFQYDWDAIYEGFSKLEKGNGKSSSSEGSILELEDGSDFDIDLGFLLEPPDDETV